MNVIQSLKLIFASILWYPDVNADDFILDTDASNTDISAVLSQSQCDLLWNMLNNSVRLPVRKCWLLFILFNISKIIFLIDSFY